MYNNSTVVNEVVFLFGWVVIGSVGEFSPDFSLVVMVVVDVLVVVGRFEIT